VPLIITSRMRGLGATPIVAIDTITKMDADAFMCPIFVNPVFLHLCCPSHSGSIPCKLQGGAQSCFQRLMVGSFKKQKRYVFSSYSCQTKKIVQSTVSFLPALEAIFWGDISITGVEPCRKIKTLPHVAYLVIYCESINPAGPKVTRNFEFAKRSLAIAVAGQIARIFISVLRHELLYRAVCVTTWIDVANALKLVTSDFHWDDASLLSRDQLQTEALPDLD
jgi:hypothetical protein